MDRFNALRETALEFTRDLAALVWPVECIGCGAPDRDLCAPCSNEIRAPRAPIALTPPYDAHGEWIAGGTYAGVLRDLIVAFKHGRTVFTRDLAEVLTPALVSLLRSVAETGTSDPPLLVPAPSRAKAVRDRGFRPVDMVARRALKDLHVPGVRIVRALRASAGRTSQSGLRGEERIRNASRVRLSKSMRDRVAGRTVILVDDVITSGATLAAAAAVLTSAGARVTGACSIAAVKSLKDDSLTPEGRGNV